MAVLCLLAGGGSESIAATIPIPAQGGLIGRGEHVAMQVLEPSVAHEHAKLVRTPMGWQVMRVEGGGPLEVSGQLVETMGLESGDVLTLGEVRLRFEANDPNVKSTVVLSNWEPPSAVRRRLEAPPTAFEGEGVPTGESGEPASLDAGDGDSHDPLARPEGDLRGRPTQRPKRILPGPQAVAGFDPVSTGLQAPTGLGAAPPVESDFNRDIGLRAGEAARSDSTSSQSAAQRSIAARSDARRAYAGWVVAALLAIAVIWLAVNR